MKPSRLPAHFAAKPVRSAKDVDLSQFAANSVSEETIVPGDVIEVVISAGLAKDDTIELSSRVGEQGFADLPQIGRVHVAGQALETAESTILKASVERGVYRKPQVTVTMKQPKVVRVTVAGAVNKPGTYELRPGSSDLLHALVSAGSLDDDAGTNIEIRQPGSAVISSATRAPLVAGADGAGDGTQLVGYNEAIPAGITAASDAEFIQVNLTSLTTESTEKYKLKDGAVIYVEEQDLPPLSVSGLVKRPSRYVYPVGENLRLLDAISLAGGETSVAANKVFVIREVEHNGKRERGVIQASIYAAKQSDSENILLMPGDLVSVEKTPVTVFLSTITEVGFNMTGRAF